MRIEEMTGANNFHRGREGILSSLITRTRTMHAHSLTLQKAPKNSPYSLSLLFFKAN